MVPLTNFMVPLTKMPGGLGRARLRICASVAYFEPAPMILALEHSTSILQRHCAADWQKALCCVALCGLRGVARLEGAALQVVSP
jgi:hypothetical protein